MKKIEVQKNTKEQAKVGGGVVMGSKIKRTKEFIDKKTGQVVRREEN